MEKENTVLKEKLLGLVLKDEETKREQHDNIETVVIEIPNSRDGQDGFPLEEETDWRYSSEELFYIVSDFLGRNPSKKKSDDLENLKRTMEKGQKWELVFKRKDLTSRGGHICTECCYVVCVILKNDMRPYADLVEYIITGLLDSMETGTELEIFLSGGRNEFLESLQEKWILLGKFAEFFLNEHGLPEAETLIELSAAKYEGSESEARIYFTDKTVLTVDTFACIGEENRVIKSENLRMIRKLLEISKSDKVYLYAEWKEIQDKGKKDKQLVISRLVRKKGKKEGDIYIKFTGFMHWSVVLDNKEKLTYYHGRYRLNDSNRDTRYEKEIEELHGVDRDMIKSLVKILKNQKHGTSVIISDFGGNVKKTVDQLCELNRGIRVSDKIRYDKEKGGWNKDVMLSITGIDGALFMDLKGQCLALGMLVDGEAKIKGDVGRGARYNSIRNYVEQKEQGIYVAIVISEDGMINVVANKNAASSSPAS